MILFGAHVHGSTAPIGVILAGGLGRRMGGAKANVELRGRPLICYPVEALREALDEVVVIAKADTELPSLAGVPVWIEPPGPRHPLAGIVHALGLAAGRGVLVCAADMPFVTPALVTRIAATDPAGAPAVVPTRAGELQPLLALYLPAAAAALGHAVDAGRPLRREVAAIGPRLLEIEDPRAFYNVNTPADLLRAGAILDRA
jgi:molybdopterin-guanine dinucleotide biosynthesis protein A